ncbi:MULTISPECIES: hypothetical protein [unclassified Streptomyces]|uniref:hypothetical protein n=1 Tax=unclassified Streptomyces TaxID=2593676 RepID=UPI002E172DBE
MYRPPDDPRGAGTATPNARQELPVRLLPEASTAPTTPTIRAARQEEARAQALRRVCDGFTTTISPHSAARLADLMTASRYEKAA